MRDLAEALVAVAALGLILPAMSLVAARRRGRSVRRALPRAALMGAAILLFGAVHAVAVDMLDVGRRSPASWAIAAACLAAGIAVVGASGRRAGTRAA